MGLEWACLVPFRVAMGAIRHSRIERTTCAPKLQRRSMDYYTAPVLLDVGGAVGSLPDFSFGQGDSANRTARGARATIQQLTGTLISRAGAPVAPSAWLPSALLRVCDRTSRG